jgi:DNA gyrase/topoisomerase IV subunit B
LSPKDISSSCGTTVDLEARILYQVRIDRAGEADRIFETLMGDVVEPRREFIQDEAEVKGLGGGG